MGTLFLLHWYVGAGLPVAAELNVTVSPTFADCETGTVVKEGVVAGPVVVVTRTRLRIRLPLGNSELCTYTATVSNDARTPVDSAPDSEWRVIVPSAVFSE